MSKIKILLLFLALKMWPIQAEVKYHEFDYAQDMSSVESILRKEWPKLFFNPNYDEQFVHSIFYKKCPGDIYARYTKVIIDVLHEDGKLIGFISYYFKRDHIGHVELLAIDPDHQKKGYGKLLIEKVIQKFKAANCKQIQLYVYTTNPKAIQFYKRLNFSIKSNFGSYLLLSKDI